MSNPVLWINVSAGPVREPPSRRQSRAVPHDGGTVPSRIPDTLVRVLRDLHLDAADPSGTDLPCRIHDPELWFAVSPTDLEQAKALCRSCPVRLQCLAGALRRQEPWGVWGGEILDRGRVIARKRPRGRPPKVAVTCAR